MTQTTHPEDAAEDMHVDSADKSYIIPIDERQYSPPPEAATDYLQSTHYTDRSPLIIDNGSSELRAGFATQCHTPSLGVGYDAWSGAPVLAFDNVVARYRDRKRNQTTLLAGSDAYLDQQSRSSIRTPFDVDVVCNYDVMENVLDYTFIKLGIEGENVDHPIVMSETLCNPLYSRGCMNELLFETYNVPSVAYGLDALYSAYANDVQDGVAVSCGRASTLIVPIVGGRGVLSNSKRLNWGGSQATDYLLRLAQLKYPNFPVRVTAPQAAHLLETQTFVSCDYAADLAACEDPQSMGQRDVVVQFPYSEAVSNVKTEEEVRALAERRKESGRRLQEQTQKLRTQKLLEKENALKYYAQLQEWKTKESKEAYEARLDKEGFADEAELEDAIKKTRSSIRRSRAREEGYDALENQEAPTFPLINTPDHQLDEEGIKEKRRQRLLKAGYDARVRQKAEKEESKRLASEEKARDEALRLEDPERWVRERRKDHADAIERIRKRKKLKEMLSDRKSLAAQQRMKSITTLASDQPAGKKKRKRGGDEDTFGADDDDWGVYRDIRGADDSEEEEDEQATLATIEASLLAHDTTFTPRDTYSSFLERKNALTNSFLRGVRPAWDAESVEQAHQLHLNVERFRVPEVLFQPNLAGVDQAGLDELCTLVLGSFDAGTRARMLQNIFLTGRSSQYPHLDTRLRQGLISTQPTGTVVRVVRARDARFDAWRGMARWSLERREERVDASVTKAEWEEKGMEWFKDHGLAGSIAP